ncbi:hypothetical protein [Microvirga pakistanensis]|uniref:hypothetical protein n=1 Tax=Microvirga pakistanensis TaxID=1682650 RepID=UPI00106B823F|nr:hypothetical protein [Microvirga pakistanensis]
MQLLFQGLLIGAVFVGISLSAMAQETAQPPLGSAPGITIELNKLEQTGSACRSYFVVNNGAADPLKELRLAVYLFDRTGMILRSVALTFSDVRASRSKVVMFDIPEVPCDSLSRLIVNDITTCASASGAPLAACSSIVTRTRTNAEFIY